MSFLHPLFLLGALAVAIPVVLHLARRRTRKEIPFGSLMFLAPTAPRFEARKQLEHWLLLALRCLAVALLAAALARPFLDRVMPPAAAAGVGERVVLLVDTSASMKRGGLWNDAVARARARLERARPNDRLAVMTFGRQVETLIGFDGWAALAATERARDLGDRLAALAPGWGGTELGRALVAAAEAIVDDQGQDATGVGRVVVVSDLQEGSRLEALSGIQWPLGVALELETVGGGGATNAGLHALPERDTAAAEAAPLRVRVSNARAGGAERFRLRWEDGGGSESAEVKVAPGASQVVPAPVRSDRQARGALVIAGDDHDFDNRLFVAPSAPAPVRILYMGGDDGSDAQGPLFYLRRAFPATRRLVPEIVARRPGDRDLAAAAAGAHLLVAATALPPAAVAAVREHLARGRSALLVLDGPAAAATVGQLAGGGDLGATEVAGAQAGAGYALLSQVDLGHPLLAAFADPRFGDFTKIRFWKHRRLDDRRLPGARVLARFDDGSPAWLTVAVGKGALMVMTSGWHPADSQLALSSKMVPLLHAILESSAGLDSGQGQFSVGDAVALPATARAERRVRKPDGAVTVLPAEATAFTETDVPGLYTLESGDAARTFAVNLDPAESATAPLAPEALERFGLLPGKLRDGAAAPAADAQTQAAARQVAERRAFQVRLEGQQRLWRWVVLAMLMVLLFETWLAAFMARRVRA